MFKLGDHVRKVRGIYNLGMTGVVVGVDENAIWKNLKILIRSDGTFLLIDSFTGQPCGGGAPGTEAWGDPRDWEKIAPWEAMDEDTQREELGIDEEVENVVCR